jgi:hypothetical protein
MKGEHHWKLSVFHARIVFRLSSQLVFHLSSQLVFHLKWPDYPAETHPTNGRTTPEAHPIRRVPGAPFMRSHRMSGPSRGSTVRLPQETQHQSIADPEPEEDASIKRRDINPEPTPNPKGTPSSRDANQSIADANRKGTPSSRDANQSIADASRKGTPSSRDAKSIHSRRQPEGHAFRRAVKTHREAATALPEAGAESEGRSDRSIAVAFHPAEIDRGPIRAVSSHEWADPPPSRDAKSIHSQPEPEGHALRRAVKKPPRSGHRSAEGRSEVRRTKRLIYCVAFHPTEVGRVPHSCGFVALNGVSQSDPPS